MTYWAADCYSTSYWYILSKIDYDEIIRIHKSWVRMMKYVTQGFKIRRFLETELEAQIGERGVFEFSILQLG